LAGDLGNSCVLDGVESPFVVGKGNTASIEYIGMSMPKKGHWDWNIAIIEFIEILGYNYI
jgi:hypothetical protein